MWFFLDFQHYVINMLGEKEQDMTIAQMKNVFFKLTRKCFH